MRALRKAAVAAVAAVALGAAGCSGGTEQAARGGTSRQAAGAPEKPAPEARGKLIGDGSTADTGAQPNQPVPERLAPGGKPPQFVVFSWDGAGEDGRKLFSYFRALGKRYGASMTYFLSGVHLVPDFRRSAYRPPRHPRGASAIGFSDTEDIPGTLRQVRLAWLDGSEIGTHFNGHFCGPKGGVGTWSGEEWMSEIRQAESFVERWKTHTGRVDLPPLPFDYGKELVGGRAPCLEGQKNLIPAAKAMGFRYDASSPGGRQVWPEKIDGIWDFPLQRVPVPGLATEVLSMDHDFLAHQSGTGKGDPARHIAWGDQMRDGLLAGFERAYRGNRAPFFVGNHFESWNGGTYMRAVEETIKTVCVREEVRCVSFKQLADWLDAQDPRVLAKLGTLGVGERPKGGWGAFLAAAAPDPSPAPGGEEVRDAAVSPTEP